MGIGGQLRSSRGSELSRNGLSASLPNVEGKLPFAKIGNLNLEESFRQVLQAIGDVGIAAQYYDPLQAQMISVFTHNQARWNVLG